MNLTIGDTFSNGTLSIVYTHSEDDYCWVENGKTAKKVPDKRLWFLVPEYVDGAVGILASEFENYLKEKQLTKE